MNFFGFIATLSFIASNCFVDSLPIGKIEENPHNKRDTTFFNEKTFYHQTNNNNPYRNYPYQYGGSPYNLNRPAFPYDNRPNRPLNIASNFRANQGRQGLDSVIFPGQLPITGIFKRSTFNSHNGKGFFYQHGGIIKDVPFLGHTKSSNGHHPVSIIGEPGEILIQKQNDHKKNLNVDVDLRSTENPLNIDNEFVEEQQTSDNNVSNKINESSSELTSEDLFEESDDEEINGSSNDKIIFEESSDDLEESEISKDEDSLGNDEIYQTKSDESQDEPFNYLNDEETEQFNKEELEKEEFDDEDEEETEFESSDESKEDEESKEPIVIIDSKNIEEIGDVVVVPMAMIVEKN